MSVSRRDALRGLMSIGAVAITQAMPTRLVRGEQATKQEMMIAADRGIITSPSVSPDDQVLALLQTEVDELVRYRKRVHALRDELASRDTTSRCYLSCKGCGLEVPLQQIYDDEQFCFQRINSEFHATCQRCNYSGVWSHIERPWEDPTPPCAVSLPYATVPLNFYARLTKAQLDITEPRIPKLHSYMQNQWGNWYVNESINMLGDTLGLIPRGVEVLAAADDFTVFGPDGTPTPRDRVVSPRYVIDVDEPYFGMRTTANMIIDAVDGIWGEWRCRIEVAEQTCRNFHNVPIQTVSRVQVRKLQVHIVREAFMLEFFCWSTGAGWTKPRNV